MKRIVLLAAALIMAGCAKFPAYSVSSTARVIFKMKVAGKIRHDYLYYFAFQASTASNPDSTTGPLPVISYPAQNGFVAGKPTHFILFSYDMNPVQPFSLNKFVLTTAGDFTTPDISKWSNIGVPISYSSYDPGTDTSTIQCEISLDQLTDGDVTLANSLQCLLVNFLTMNKVSTTTYAGRVIDALGDTRLPSEINTVFRVPLTTSATYSNTTTSTLEPTGDVIDQNGSTLEPDLDITDWSVEVRLP